MARSTAYKVAANSFYGVVGASTSRYFDKSIAESTTQNGVWLIKRVMSQGEKRKIVSVAGDTDSAFVVGPTRDGFDTFIRWLNEKDLPTAIAATGVKESFVKLAYEKAFDVIVFSGKKRYCGMYSHYKWKTTCNHCKDAKGNPGSVDVRTMTCADCKHVYTKMPKFIGKPEIKGLEYRRGDTSRIGRELQGRIIDLLVGGLHTNPDLDANGEVERPVMDLEVYYRIIKEVRDRVMSQPLSVEDVRQSKGINKDSLKEYSTKKKADGEDGAQAPHVLVAHILEARGQSVSKGTRIEYVTVDGDCSPMKVIPAEDYRDECDRYYLWDTLIYPPSQRLLEGAFPDVDWAKWGDIRPKKVKTKNKVIPDQLGYDFDTPRHTGVTRTNEELAVAAFSTQPLIIHVSKDAGSKAVDRVIHVLKKFPGARLVEIHIENPNGATSVYKSNDRVTTGPLFASAIEDAIDPLSKAPWEQDVAS
jgi:DNA polymerase elongation subunit (family B)